MAEKSSFDYAETETDLFCNEGTKGFNLGEIDFVDSSPNSNGEKDVIFFNGGFISLPYLSEECVGWMLEREKEHLPRFDYLMRLRNGEVDQRLRREALEWMFKACARYYFGDLCLCLAMRYLDRFLSFYESRVENETWLTQLTAVACLSLASKLEEVNVPPIFELQTGQPKFLFEAKTIQRMEMLVLSTLKWKIKACTPFNFIDYYLRKMIDDKSPSGDVIDRSLEIITRTIEGTEFLEFKPSEIAAAVALYVSGETQEMVIDKALSASANIGVEKARVEKCTQLIQEMAPTIRSAIPIDITDDDIIIFSGGSESSSELDSPNGVLEATSFSYESDEGSVDSLPSSHENKRMRLV